MVGLILLYRHVVYGLLVVVSDPLFRICTYSLDFLVWYNFQYVSSHFIH